MRIYNIKHYTRLMAFFAEILDCMWWLCAWLLNVQPHACTLTLWHFSVACNAIQGLIRSVWMCMATHRMLLNYYLYRIAMLVHIYNGLIVLHAYIMGWTRTPEPKKCMHACMHELRYLYNKVYIAIIITYSFQASYAWHKGLQNFINWILFN